MDGARAIIACGRIAAPARWLDKSAQIVQKWAI